MSEESNKQKIRNIPAVRTPTDIMGNEIPSDNKGDFPENEDRTTIVKQKHENKYKRAKQSDK